MRMNDLETPKVHRVIVFLSFLNMKLQFFLFPYRLNKTTENQWSCSERSNKADIINTSNEIISSNVSSDGNVMSLVMRSKNNREKAEKSEDADQSKIVKSCNKTQLTDPVSRSPRSPARLYRSDRIVNRSKNFWASYNNFILCNRSIELRITKLYSIQNTQYIIAFSNDFFEYTENMRTAPLKRKISHQSYCVIQFMQVNINACIAEVLSIEHIIDFKMLINCNESRTMSTRLPLLIELIGDEFSGSNTLKSESASRLDNTSDYNGLRYREASSNRRINVTMKFSVLVLSVCVFFVFIRNLDFL